MEEELRARALLRIVPALVHRLNNSLAVVQGVQELGPSALEAERELARVELANLGQALARLATLARAPAPRAQALDVADLLGCVGVLVRPLAASAAVALELRADGTASVRLDGRLEALLVAACAELLDAGARNLRLCARAAHEEVRLTLTAAGIRRASPALSALQAHARELEWDCAWHASAAGTSLRLTLPASGATCPVHAPRVRAGRRVLLLHGADLERELAATLLEEHGYVVVESAEEPRAGVPGRAFDLALVEQRLALADPALPARLCARFALERVALLEPRMRPGALLALLSR